jgi:non-canonical (house-cleaning) NTP pyrophosphatase
VGHGPGYTLPQEVLDRLMNGSTLNREMSRLSGIPEIKEKEGAIGILFLIGPLRKVTARERSLWFGRVLR